MIYEYFPENVCSKKFTFDIEDGVIRSFSVVGGCRGNLQGIARLIQGMRVDDVIEKFSGIICRNGTSCPDQISRALRCCRSEHGV